MIIRQYIKILFKSPIVISIVAFFIAQYIRFLRLTMRAKIVGADNFTNMQKPAIFCSWHGRTMMIACFRPKGFKMNALISRHADGRLIAGVQRSFGIGVISGSTSKGGAAAVREILRSLKNGDLLAITPDGPRGPARKVAGLSIEIAKKLDIPIIPVTFSCSRYKTVRSWDSFMIPKPFSKGIFVFGEAKKFETAKELETALNKITDEADSAFKTL